MRQSNYISNLDGGEGMNSNLPWLPPYIKTLFFCQLMYIYVYNLTVV